jgi:hypothetical protein
MNPARDRKGCGGMLPAVRWPGDAPLAVSFVVNFEEGAEFWINDDDHGNEAVYEANNRLAGPDPSIDSHSSTPPAPPGGASPTCSATSGHPARPVPAGARHWIANAPG